MPSPKIYLGCSLTQAPEDFLQGIVDLKSQIKEKYELIEFFSDPLSVNQQSTELEICQRIYEFDKNCVESCDLMIAEVSYPSIGLGMELAFAVTNNKPILAVAKNNAKVSRMIMGICHPKFQFIRYDDTKEIPAILDQFIASQE